MKKKSSLRDKMSDDIKKSERSGSNYGYLNLPKGVNIFSPEPSDRVMFDILMYEVTDPKHMDRNEELEKAIPGTFWWKHPFMIHRNIGISSDGRGGDSVVCLGSIGKKCPICEYRAKRIKEGADKEETTALRPSKRNLYLVMPLKNKKFEEKPHIFDISDFNFQKLLTEECKENEDFQVFPDMEEGLSLKVRFEEKVIGKGQPFPEASRIDFIERDGQYGEDTIAKLPKLDECLVILSYAELEAKFLEIDHEEDGGKITKVKEEEDENTIVRKPARRVVAEEEEEPIKKPAKKVVAEEEEEEVKPAKKTISRAVKPAEEEDEDESVKKPTKKDKCPHGHRFGIDTEEFNECDDCDIWKECLDTKRKK